MNILLLNSSNNWGGNEFWSATAANELNKKGNKIILACRSNIFDERLSTEISTFKLPFKHEFDLITIKKLRAIIRSENIDILLPTKRKEYVIAGRLGKKLGIPVVFRLGIMRNIPRWDIFQRYVYNKLPSAIIVNAQAIKTHLLKQKISNSNKIHVIYNGYNFQNVQKDCDVIARQSGKFIFAAAGRLTAQKGYDILLEAAALLRKKRNDFKIYIAGDGGEKEDYIRFIESSNLQNTVILTGDLQNIRGFFNKADCVVIPSRSEGIPNTLFEAWSVKKPVIASNAAGIPEVVNTYENGILINLSPSEISDVMEYMIENPNDANRFGENGYIKLMTDFTLDKMVNQLEELFVSNIFIS